MYIKVEDKNSTFILHLGVIGISRIGKMKEAGHNINDEFYTPYDYIEKELFHYKEQFKDKIVYCNCDDYTKSNFFLYFKNIFNLFGLKELICSSYNPNGNGVVAHMDKHKTSIYNLKGNGDFRSDECVDLMKKSDIVVTNPPFSITKELVQIVLENKKKFLILWNLNAVTYKEIFPLLRDDSIRIGYGFNDIVDFIMPQEYNLIKDGKRDGYIDSDGNKHGYVRSITWFTNLETYKEIDCSLDTKDNQFVKYDNYDAINIDKVIDIPYNYYGVMGVPITYLGKHDKNKFNIIGLASRKEYLSGIKTTKDYSNYIEYNQKREVVSNNGKKINGNPVIKGIPKRGNYFKLNDDCVYSLYARLFIQRVE